MRRRMFNKNYVRFRMESGAFSLLRQHNRKLKTLGKFSEVLFGITYKTSKKFSESNLRLFHSSAARYKSGRKLNLINIYASIAGIQSNQIYTNIETLSADDANKK